MTHPNFLSGLGAVLSIFLSSVGASWASVPAGLWAIHNLSSQQGDGRSGSGHSFLNCMFRSCFSSFAPIMIAGLLALYGTIVAVVITYSNTATTTKPSDEMSAGYRSLTAGLVVGLSCLTSGGGLARFLQQVKQSQNNVSLSITNHTDCQMTEQQHQPLLTNRHHESDITTPICNVRFLMVLVFLEAIGLYGLMVALLILSTGN
jgi:F0F1-type ATP synthase membrane subunit c/vacuolar-type H+-ATPase subunit K